MVLNPLKSPSMFHGVTFGHVQKKPTFFVKHLYPDHTTRCQLCVSMHHYLHGQWCMGSSCMQQSVSQRRHNYMHPMEHT